MTHQGTQTIQTRRLTLRRFVSEDAEVMFSTWANDSRVTRFLTWQPHESAEATRELLTGWCALYANPAYYHWGIEYEGRLIGGINVVRQNERDAIAELGYCIGYDYWRRGITAEAAKAVIGYLFREVAVHRVEIRHAVDNPASGRVAEKCGLTAEGILRSASMVGTGEYKDIRVWSILRDEWEARQ